MEIYGLSLLYDSVLNTTNPSSLILRLLKIKNHNCLNRKHQERRVNCKVSQKQTLQVWLAEEGGDRSIPSMRKHGLQQGRKLFSHFSVPHKIISAMILIGAQ